MRLITGVVMFAVLHAKFRAAVSLEGIEFAKGVTVKEGMLLGDGGG